MSQAKKFAPSASNVENSAAVVDTSSTSSGVDHSRLPRADDDTTLREKDNLNGLVDPNNPLIGISEEELLASATAYAMEHDMEDYVDEFRKGALIAQNPAGLGRDISMLTDADRQSLLYEYEHRWSQPKALYSLVVLCSLAAAVQGMDETVINGANLFYPSQFGIGSNSDYDTWIVGLVNSGPYLCCAVIGCWISGPMNNFFGRRGTIFISCLIAAATCIWGACTNTWWHLFISRFFLGLGIGAKSATVPVYSAECTPAVIRGALVMMWQMWTAFGIMLGYVADVAFYYVPDKHNITGLNWRLMIGSACFPAILVCAQVFFCPESPRWYMGRNQHRKAFESMQVLRGNDLQAARDVYYMHVLLVQEQELKRGHNLIRELVTIPRNRRAALASWIVMFMQQFCGVNVIAYYSSSIFQDSGFSAVSALLASMGFGIINFLFAIPAVYTIDTFGRRWLLLVTFPLMALFLLFTGFSFYIPGEKARVGCVALGIYLFAIVYSPGEGPVPFTYSAEAFPLYIRDLGMSFATATTWFFNFILSLTWPRLQKAFTTQGAFGWYAAWNVIGFFLVLFFVPETKALTLEELDRVFAVPTRTHMKYQLSMAKWFVNARVFGKKDAVRPPPLFELRYVAPVRDEDLEKGAY
ncbi:MFS sugar transporter [Myxozyma melibiosi]|uniref:MFS sugar transporter n=1 Tax=Myxozyma melibiosi TaxID=54550 RepID=A0ABR1F894_9ASCO